MKGSVDLKAFSFLLLLTLLTCGLNRQAWSSEIAYQQNQELSQKLNMPVYQWHASNGNPKAIVLMVHGLVMHGRTFDALAKELSAQGFEVFSTDMRGYGQTNSHAARQKVDYEKSFEDIVSLAQYLKKTYSKVPFYGLGESLGADFVIHLASSQPGLVDGLILSAPAIRHRYFLDPHFFTFMSVGLAKPRSDFSLVHFMRNYATNDPLIVEELMNDPLVRKSISVLDLYKSRRIIQETIGYADSISPNTSVLIIQGNEDRCVKTNAVVCLLKKLRCQDQTVRWFPENGHILLETAHVKPEALSTVIEWLEEHTILPKLQANKLEQVALNN